MTISQMHQSFRFGMDKMDGLNYPNFLPEEIDLLLNQAQERFVKQRYGTTNNKRTSFEETQKRTEDLKTLVKDATITPSAFSSLNIDSKALFYTLPTDCWFIVQERVIQHCDTCNDFAINSTTGKFAEVRPIQHLEFDKTVLDAFKGPDYNKVLRLMYTNHAEIITATYCTSLQYKLRYIKKPVKISLTTPTDCELSDHTHQEIVDTAIVIALEGVEAKRTQTYTPLIDNSKE